MVEKFVSEAMKENAFNYNLLASLTSIGKLLSSENNFKQVVESIAERDDFIEFLSHGMREINNHVATNKSMQEE